MRTMGFRTHVLFAVAGAIGIIASLGRPWYAQAPAPPDETAAIGIGELQGPVEKLSSAVSRWAGDSTGTSGWDALGEWGTALAVLAAVTAVGALGCLVPALQGVARELLRYGGLACFAIAAWKLLDTPGPNEVLELRNGAFIAALAALIACTSAVAVAGAPAQRSG